MSVLDQIRQKCWLICLCSFLLAGCASQPVTPPAMPSAPNTPNTPATAGTTSMVTAEACGTSQQVSVQIGQMDEAMQRFMEIAQAASSVSPDELAGPLDELQNIYNGAAAHPAPACLTELQQSQLGYMNVLINAMTGLQKRAPAEQVNNDLARLRELRKAYETELMRLTTPEAAPDLFTPTP